MGFSVRVAPGIRVRASSRGIRTSIGPRAMRVHVGGGRPGISTGVGPVSFYTSLGAGSRALPRTSQVRGPRSAAGPRQGPSPAAAAKAAEAQRLAAAFSELTSIHRGSFAPAQQPMALAPDLPDDGEVRRRHEKTALRGLSILRRSARAAAREHAAHAADQELESARMAAQSQWASRQHDLDVLWASLVDNNPDIVLSTLAEAFEDNEANAAPLAVDGDEVSIALLAPDESIVPERMPGTTAAGNLSLRRLPKGERAALYTTAVLGHVLVTLREAFAVCPGLRAARIVVLRAGAAGAGGPPFECLLAGLWTRSALDGVAWDTADASAIAPATAEELLISLRGGKQLQPVDLSREPAIAALLNHVDGDELVD